MGKIPLRVVSSRLSFNSPPKPLTVVIKIHFIWREVVCSILNSLKLSPNHSMVVLKSPSNASGAIRKLRLKRLSKPCSPSFHLNRFNVLRITQRKLLNPACRSKNHHMVHALHQLKIPLPLGRTAT